MKREKFERIFPAFAFISIRQMSSLMHSFHTKKQRPHRPLLFSFSILKLGNIFFVSQRKCSGTLLPCDKFLILSVTFLSGTGVLCISGFDRISDSHFFQFFLHSAIKTKNFEHSQNLQACASIAQLDPLSGDIP